LQILLNNYFQIIIWRERTLVLPKTRENKSIFSLQKR